jgi:TP901 family phage tail tape measure protein
MAADQKAKIEIEAAVEGIRSVRSLADEVENVGGTADGVREQLDQFDAELRQLEDQRALLSQLEALQDRINKTGAALSVARDKQRDLSNQVTASLGPTRQQITEQQNATTALVKLGTRLNDAKERQRDLTAQVVAAEQPNQALIERQIAATERVEGLGRAYDVAKARLEAATNAVKAGGEPTASLAQKHERATEAVEKLNAGAEHEARLLTELKSKLAAAGVDTSNLASADANLAAQFAQVNSQSDRVGASLLQQKTAINDLRSAFATLDVKPFQEVQREVESVRLALKRLEQANREGTVSDRELAKAKVEAAQKIRDLQQATNGVIETLGRAKTALQVFGASVIASGVAASKVVGDYRAFERELANISTLVEEVPAQLGDLARQVEELGGTFGKAPTEEAKALYEIISSGAGDAAESVGLLTAANKLAIGGVTDVKTAADGLTSTLAAYGFAADKATDVSDAMFVAAADGKTTIEELSRSIGQAAPIASQTGVSIDELLASVAALTKGGVKTAEALTSVRGVISAVLKPSDEAAKLAKELGLQFDLQALKAKGLAGFLDDVRAKTGGSAEKMSVLFGQIEATNGALALTGNQADSFAQSLQHMADKAGKTEEAFGKVASTSDFKFDQLAAQSDIARERLGALIAEAILPLAEGMTSLLRAFNEAPASVQAATAVIVGTGPALLSFGASVRAISAALALLKAQSAGVTFASLVTGMDAAGGAISRTTALLGLFMKALIPTAAVTLGLASIAVAFFTIKSRVDELREANEQLRESTQTAAEKERELAAAIEQRLQANKRYADAAILSAQQLNTLSQDQQRQYFASIEGAQRYYQALELQQKQLGNLAAAEAAAARMRELNAASLEAVLQANKRNSDAAILSAQQLSLLSTDQRRTYLEALDSAQRYFKTLEQQQLQLGNFGAATAAAVQVQELGAAANEARGSLEKLAGVSFTGLNQQQAFLAKWLCELGSSSNSATDEIIAAFSALENGSADTGKALAALSEYAFANLRLKGQAALTALYRDQQLLNQQAAALPATYTEAQAAISSALSKTQADIDRLKGSIQLLQAEGLNRLKSSFEELGLTSQAALQKSADAATAAYDKIRTSGVAAAGDIDRAFAIMADRQLQAAAAAGDSQLKQEAGALRIKASTDDQRVALDELIAKYPELAQAGGAAMEHVAEKTRDTNAELDALKQQIVSATELNQLQAVQRQLTAAYAAGKIGAEEYQAAVEAVKQKTEELAQANQGFAASIANFVTAARDRYAQLSDTAVQAFDRISKAAVVEGGSVSNYIERINNGIATLDRTVAEQAQRADILIRNLQDVGGATIADIRLAEQAASSFDYLDKTRLDGLNSAIAAANNRVSSLRDNIHDTVSSLRDELDQLRGDTAAIEQRRRDEQRANVEAQLDAAKQSRDQEAQRQAQEALRLLDQIESETAKQEAAAAKQSATASTPQQVSTTSSAITTTTLGRYEITLRIAGQSVDVYTDSQADALALINALQQAQAVSI